jgi:hypothetical protein
MRALVRRASTITYTMQGYVRESEEAENHLRQRRNPWTDLENNPSADCTTPRRRSAEPFVRASTAVVGDRTSQHRWDRITRRVSGSQIERLPVPVIEHFAGWTRIPGLPPSYTECRSANRGASGPFSFQFTDAAEERIYSGGILTPLRDPRGV